MRASRRGLSQQLKTFSWHFERRVGRNSRHIAAWPSEAYHESDKNWVGNRPEHNWAGRRCLLCGGRRRGARGDKDVNSKRHQLSRGCEELPTKVKTKLTTDRVKNLVSVNVDTKDGVVHLKGTVPNEQAKAEAERLAKDTDGVVSVTNNITVSPPKK